MENGYLYVATGQQHIEEARTSARSLKRLNPSIHITLITDSEDDIEPFDKIIYQAPIVTTEGWKEGLLYKVNGLLLSPYRKTFFVDSDTYFIEDCSELFEILDFYDLLIAHAPADKSEVDLEGKKLTGYHPYNTGVIVFKNNEATDKLISDWIDIYKRKFNIYPHDQTPFMESLLVNQIKLYVLKPIYNFRVPFIVALPGLRVKLLHGRVKNFEILAKKLNSKMIHRAWIPRGRYLVFEHVGSIIKKLIKATLT